MTASDIPTQVQQLASEDALERQKARLALEGLGTAAGDAVVELVGHARKEVRWEAAKTLAKIGTAGAAPALAGMLDDDDAGNRWVAGEALVHLGKPGVEAVLSVLEKGDTSPELRAAAHHVLHDVADGTLKSALAEVRAAISGPSPDEATPVAAAEALTALRG